ncbi:MAG: hypothetical protein HN509_17575 [Halobacteriovoraceae bacterium]|mgnify:CR=1 FL=1|jgi:hypothetical protein|nr:hypothetical protein [Halobacteriovoraceae bacterium]
MALYLMVRGPKADPKFATFWQGSVLKNWEIKKTMVESFQEMEADEWIYIHRVSEGYGSPLIVGKTKVEKLDGLNLSFKEWVQIDLKPNKRSAFKGFYQSEPVDEGVEHAIVGEGKPYSIRGRFEVGDIIDHPTFGKGKVSECFPDYVWAIFMGCGKKRLVHGK